MNNPVRVGQEGLRAGLQILAAFGPVAPPLREANLGRGRIGSESRL